MTGTMAKSKRLEIRTTPELRAALEAEAARRGQSLNVFAERAFEAALRVADTHAPACDLLDHDGPCTISAGEAIGDDTPRPSPAGRKAKSEAAPRPARPAAASRQGASRPLTPIAPGALRVHTPNCKCAMCKPPRTAKGKA